MESPGPSAFIGHLLPCDPQLTSPACQFFIFFIFTGCKRSLRRLCFYTCLSVILFTGGVLVSVPGGLCPGGSLSRGSLSRGTLSGGLCPGGSLSRGVSVWGVPVQGRSLSRGISVQGVSLQGRALSAGISVRGVSVQGVSVWGGLCQGGSLSGRVNLCEGDPSYGILLECILVVKLKLFPPIKCI